MTSFGALDLLGAIQLDLGFEELVGDAEWFDLDGLRVRVLKLERLIELKRVLGRSKDLAVVPTLEATLQERRRGGG
jgi:predicted nucleotidyltransferase